MKEASPIPRTQEVGVWWGGYSPWTMLPSFIVSIVLTGVITWWSFTYLTREVVQLAILGLTGLLWLVQSWRFAYRVFGYNYHVTTRRLIQDWGIIYKRMRMLVLEEIARIEVDQAALEQLLGVGRVIFRPRDAKQPPMIWRGLRNRNQVADLVQALLQQASKNEPAV